RRRRRQSLRYPHTSAPEALSVDIPSVCALARLDAGHEPFKPGLNVLSIVLRERMGALRVAGAASAEFETLAIELNADGSVSKMPGQFGSAGFGSGGAFYGRDYV